MKENKLIASVVVFKELLDHNKDIYDIIAEFLKAAILDKKLWSFSATEIRGSLEEIFDFKLPEAVIKSTLKNRLVKKGFLSYEKGQYNVKDINQKLDSEFESNFLSKKDIYKRTEEEFIDFVEKKKGKTFSSSEKDKVRENIGHYLLGNGINEPYTQDISEYIIKRKNDIDFLHRLNTVKEGFVLYTGIRYTADLNELGSWKNKLTIFLDTEIIFNFFGYNGEVYKDIFNDFLKLVREINLKNSKTGKKTITLKYFEETEKEIYNFFHVASLIIEGKMTLDPSKTAMREIVNGCKTKSDILLKRNKLLLTLKTAGIEKEESLDYYEDHQYNIEGTEVLNELSKLAKEANRDFDENYCKNNLKLFTKINVLRKGISNNGFEKCRYILLTGNRYIHFLAHNDKIKDNEKDVPFATDIDFVTDKFWFKLKKGFGNSEDVPKAFDMITRAQIVLSSQISTTVQEKYTALIEKYNKGEISKEEAISLTYDLRESSLKPEDIDDSNIENSIMFINEFSIEDHLREREELNQKVKKGEAAQRELKRRDRENRFEKSKKIRNKILWFKYAALLIPIILTIALYFLGYFLIKNIKTENDSLISIVSLVIGFIGIFPIWKYLKAYISYINQKSRKSYLKQIKSSYD